MLQMLQMLQRALSRAAKLVVLLHAGEAAPPACAAFGGRVGTLPLRVVRIHGRANLGVDERGTGAIRAVIRSNPANVGSCSGALKRCRGHRH